jgi:hypothetical protein
VRLDGFAVTLARTPSCADEDVTERFRLYSLGFEIKRIAPCVHLSPRTMFSRTARRIEARNLLI